MEEIKLFSYIFNPSPEVIKSILKNGLLSVDKLPISMRTEYTKRYQKRGKDYFKNTYNKFYKKIFGRRKYINYGVYLTPINLWGLGLRLRGKRVDKLPRIEIPIKNINLNNCVLSESLKRRIRRIPTEKLIKNSVKRWTKKEIIKAWHTNKFPFVRVPQIVYFSSKPIKVTREMIKSYKK
jgi:hypothetical protein